MAVAATAAVVPSDDTEAEAGEAGPQPPRLVVLLEPSVERQQGEEGNQPHQRSYGDRAGAVYVERFDVSNDVLAIADLADVRLLERLLGVLALVHGLNLADTGA